MLICPRCKEDMPLLSKICPVCGYRIEDEEQSVSIDALVDALEENLTEIKNIPEPTLMKGMASLSFIIYPLIAAFLLAAALMSEAGLFWILFLLFAVLSLVSIIKKMRGTLGNEPWNRHFKHVRNDFEQGERLAKRYFGKNKELSTLLADISSRIEQVQKKRDAMARRNLIAWLVIMLVIILLCVQGVLSVNKLVEAAMPVNEKIELLLSKGNVTEAMELFRSKPQSSDEALEQMHIDLIAALLAAGEAPQAEEFFRTYCMGRIGDLDCASAIVAHYNETKDGEAAKAFVKGLDGMRYNSDKDKLTKMIAK